MQQSPDRPTSTLDRVLWALVGLALIAATTYLVLHGLNRSFNDSPTDFDIFFRAAKAMVEGGDPYTTATGEYIYPPLIAWMLTPLTSLGADAAMRPWVIANLLVFALSIVVLAREMARRLNLKAEPLLIASVTLLTLLANFDSMRWEFELGQCDALVLFGFAFGLRWLDKRPWVAGAALGLAFTVKYQTLLALPYLLLRGRLAAAAGMVLGAAVFLFIPAVTYGWDPTVRGVQTAFSGMLNYAGLGPGRTANAANVYPASYPRSVSLTSVVARITDGEKNPKEMVAVTGAAALLLLGLGAWIYRRRGVPLLVGRLGGAEREPAMAGIVAVEWVGLIVVALAFSPHTLVRHTFLLVPAHVLAFTILCRPRKGVSPWPLALGTLAFTLGVMLPPGNVRSTSALVTWRAVGGSTWCMLAFYFALVWTGLGYVRARPGAGVSDPRAAPSPSGTSTAVPGDAGTGPAGPR